MALFKNLKDIEFERTDPDGKTTYFVKSDGIPATLFEKTCLVSVSVIFFLGYIALRLLLGIVFVVVAIAAMIKVSLNITFVSSLHLLLDNSLNKSNVAILIIITGIIVGFGLWILEKNN